MYDRRRARPRSFRRRLLNLFIYFGFVTISVLLILNFQIYPYVASIAEAAATNSVTETINNAVYEQLSKDNLTYSDLVKITYDGNGKVSSVETDIGKLNNARSSLLLSVLRDLRNNDIMNVDIPLGNIMGGELLSGRGPLVNFKMLLAQGLHCTVDNQFLEAGINQTVHRMMLNLTVNVDLLVPTEKVTLTLTNTYCIAETIIVGEVPNAYTEINRLLDDIDEKAIDDLYDYGASVQ